LNCGCLPSAPACFPIDQSLQPYQIADHAWEMATMQAKLKDSAVSLELADTLNGMVILMSTRGVNLDSDRGCTAVRMMP
tara:strand:- start:443 stop:679 length:237 start_codon:yes stop_codon:yes gene_type:complete